jgi:hypothetical protein
MKKRKRARAEKNGKEERSEIKEEKTLPNHTFVASNLQGRAEPCRVPPNHASTAAARRKKRHRPGRKERNNRARKKRERGEKKEKERKVKLGLGRKKKGNKKKKEVNLTFLFGPPRSLLQAQAQDMLGPISLQLKA